MWIARPLWSTVWLSRQSGLVWIPNKLEHRDLAAILITNMITMPSMALNYEPGKVVCQLIKVFGIQTYCFFSFFYICTQNISITLILFNGWLNEKWITTPFEKRADQLKCIAITQPWTKCQNCFYWTGRTRQSNLLKNLLSSRKQTV